LKSPLGPNLRRYQKSELLIQISGRPTSDQNFESGQFPPNRYNVCMTDSPAQHMQCMEVWGGSQLTSSGVELGGLDVWVYSKPFGEALRGGDVYYVSSCASGRISRLLLADVSGHGQSVASTAADLRTLMRRFVNRLDQKEVVRLLNEQFTALSRHGSFATAVLTTFFAPTRRLSLCNAGHPRPLLFARPRAAGPFSVMVTTTRRRKL
jgi:hypothetical protein